jgi:hypothetical protein
VVRLVVGSPGLWPTAALEVARLARPRWWAKPPFLPVPAAPYLRFRLQTMYGAEVEPRPEDVIAWLRWCRHNAR